jgi:hypothetical protein
LWYEFSKTLDRISKLTFGSSRCHPHLNIH